MTKKPQRETFKQRLMDACRKLANNSDVGAVKFDDALAWVAKQSGIPPSHLVVKESTWDNVRKSLREVGEECYKVTYAFFRNAVTEDIIREADNQELYSYLPMPGAKRRGIGLRFAPDAEDPLLALVDDRNDTRVAGTVRNHVLNMEIRDGNGLLPDDRRRRLEALTTTRDLLLTDSASNDSEPSTD